MAVKETLKKLEDFGFWSWIGMAAGMLSIIVAMYNIKLYYDELKKLERK